MDAMTDAPPADRRTRDEPIELDAHIMGPEEGGGPPTLMPWTLVVGDDWESDLEHGAPLPRVGDRIEFITDEGERRAFRVERVVHTVQRSASTRPAVRDEAASPNSTLDGASDGAPALLRAGLPRVIVTPEE
jgi:hypothetical protein